MLCALVQVKREVFAQMVRNCRMVQCGQSLVWLWLWLWLFLRTCEL